MKKANLILILILSTMLGIGIYFSGRLTFGQSLFYPVNSTIYKVNTEVVVCSYEDFQLVLKHYGMEKNVVGLTVTFYPSGRVVVYIPLPVPDNPSTIESWGEFQYVVGHEIMHVMMRQNEGLNAIPNPDRLTNIRRFK